MLGMNLTDARRADCLGFAIQRTDHTEDEVRWLRGMKTFESTHPEVSADGQYSSQFHPCQAFQWADYTAKPGYEYTYKVVPVTGRPGALTYGEPTNVRIKTETEHGGKHSVFFNRGAAASQAYARRFLNKYPSKVGSEAYSWLSRGLAEALESFIGRAKDRTFALYGAVYEFQWPSVLKWIRDAADRGARVTILYDGIPGDKKPAAKNRMAIEAASIQDYCVPRTTGSLMHNKFFVLTNNDQPVALWTGSTNITENGIFGHSNFGHIVEDPSVAAAYLGYWNEIRSNPEPPAIERAWINTNYPAPPDPWSGDLFNVFSPHSGLGVLDWYAQIAGMGPLLMTFAFGMHRKFQEVYEQPDRLLRIALMEKEGNGRGLVRGKIDIARIRRGRNVFVAVGNYIATNGFDRWLKEIDRITPQVNVHYIHTKFMLVDPLGSRPIVVAGSANFSEASTNENNENTLVIRDDKRVADIYLGEFMRLYTHYAFRESVARRRAGGIEVEDWRPSYLIAGPEWQTKHFDPSDQLYLRRKYFARS